MSLHNVCLFGIFTLISQCTALQWKQLIKEPSINEVYKIEGGLVSNLNYLYKRRRCDQTPPRQRSTDPKPVCHFDPLLMEDISYKAFGLVVNWIAVEIKR